MGEWQPFMARDGRTFNAWLSAPTGHARGAVVVLHDIFGVNPWIRSVTDQFAAAGYLAIAPSLYDRIGHDIQLGYSDQEIQRARGYMLQVKPDDALKDISAAVNVVKHAGRVALVGYSLGGTMAWLAARTLPVRAAAIYYARLANQLDGIPAVPTLLHFGSQDTNVPLTDAEQVRARFPQGQFHFYPAGHAFACNVRSTYDAASATLAWQRTLDFLHEQLG